MNEMILQGTPAKLARRLKTASEAGPSCSNHPLQRDIDGIAAAMRALEKRLEISVV